MFMCISAFVISLAVCPTAMAQRGLENAEEFTQKVVEQAESESTRQPSNTDNEIKWQDETSSDSLDSSGQSNQQSQQGQQY